MSSVLFSGAATLAATAPAGEALAAEDDASAEDKDAGLAREAAGVFAAAAVAVIVAAAEAEDEDEDETEAAEAADVAPRLGVDTADDDAEVGAASARLRPGWWLGRLLVMEAAGEAAAVASAAVEEEDQFSPALIPAEGVVAAAAEAGLRVRLIPLPPLVTEPPPSIVADAPAMLLSTLLPLLPEKSPIAPLAAPFPMLPLSGRPPPSLDRLPW